MVGQARLLLRSRHLTVRKIFRRRDGEISQPHLTRLPSPLPSPPFRKSPQLYLTGTKRSVLEACCLPRFNISMQLRLSLPKINFIWKTG